MKIEAGKYYRTRYGQKVGPMQVPPSGRWSSVVAASCDDRAWYDHGVFWKGEIHDNDLIAEWSEPMDLTAITTPFGLLDRETQEALKAHGGPYEAYTVFGDWEELDDAQVVWLRRDVYRVKPVPPKPREWTLALSSNGWRIVHPPLCGVYEEVIHVREVLPE